MDKTPNTQQGSKEFLARSALYDAVSFKNSFTQSVMLFIQHHLDEIGAEYWTMHFGSPKPSAEQIIDKLELDEHALLSAEGLSEEDIAYHENHLDFMLPAGASQYVLCVSFVNGQVYEISMES